MSATTLVQTDIDLDVKERATAVLSELGMSLAEAVRLFLTRTADEGALPFTVDTDAAAHDAWVRARVQQALDDPRPAVPNSQVKEYFAMRRAELTATLAKS